MNKLTSISVSGTAFKMLTRPALGKEGRRCFRSIVYNFFFLQYKAALNPGKIPVSAVDHGLDNSIPFSTQWVRIYLDFIPFWIRICGFLLKTYRKRAFPAVNAFLAAMGRVYRVAAEVYTQNLSTTNRPRYFTTPRFALIHAFDPHLMCIPSLHVMVVVRAYTAFRDIIHDFGDEERFAPQLDEAWRGAIAITESLLYVKQHSINCVAASMYAMTRFDERLFGPDEARRFVKALFTRQPAADGSPERYGDTTIPSETRPAPTERTAIEACIWDRYETFLEGGKTARSWDEPLLHFLRERLPQAVSQRR